MSSLNPNNYHWTECNITGWSHDFLKRELQNMGYTTSKIEGDVHISQRMNKIGLLYTLNLTASKNGDSIILKDFDIYSDIEDILCHNDTDKQIFHKILVQMRNEAISNFSEQVILDKKCDTEVKKNAVNKLPVSKNEDTVNTNVSVEKISGYSISLLFNVSSDDLFNFFTKKEFINIWTNGEAVYGENQRFLYNLIIEKNINISDKFIKMDWKLKKWEMLSRVEISFVSQDKNCMVKISHYGVPSNDVDNLKNGWMTYYFDPISRAFGFKSI
ncbi:hypothetical protein CWI37_1405p0010 [Hamiltosporidium tvaerminnensis]|uniref:Activator of Hsp90 ATPase N-terminal domain-containing protein n=2 Tax=Hamiltosporidium TaxID=1176354 RepID=A0A4V2JV19_9MICR|nr:Co-chaperone [Hamiltosporidium tvaerminnensis]TBT99265.1 hypothetical protein CWI37_1405p0010 [Hamiltosporidium tvaerminnensis]TBU02312.1 hypothetical protein CWI39_1186p0010 [Hamiltosporidium magnivora]